METREFWMGVAFSAFLAFFITGAKLFNLGINAFPFLLAMGLLGFVFYHKTKKHGIGLGYFEVVCLIGVVGAFLVERNGFVVAAGFMFLSTPLFFLAKERIKK
ncbi:MAG: hypothetical protein QXL47_00320 [Candidatus Anstonellales archaeon]